VFFQWAIVEEHYSGENPVIPAVHGKRNKARSGRPYSEQEMTNMRLLLNERGNERLRAFFEIASESGLRKSELSRLVLGDISLDAQRVKVRLPNKGMRERTAFFSDRAATRIREWLAVRDMQCGHEFFFHNCRGGKLQGDSIPNEFKRALCKTYRDRVVNEEGLETFSIHRLRHTLTSNLASGGADATTLMTCLGWVSPSSVDGYMKLSEHAKVTGFVNAMAKVDDQVSDGFGKRVLAPEEFLLLAGENAAWNQGW
jgi:integrase/recombinase XerC